MRRTDASTTNHPLTSPVAWGLALVLLLVAAPSAAKEPQQIRQHLMDDPDRSVDVVRSVEPHHAEALDALLETTIWKVEFTEEGEQGESLIFMAVHDGDVFRIADFDQPRARDNFLRLLPEDFRVQSETEAKQLVAATLDLYFGFPFSEPELTVDEMRFQAEGTDYYLVDGERFGDATGYHITTDADGRVTGYEYSWELPVEPLED